MKTCPVCKSTLFDDMEVCYGCMYEFGTRPDLECARAATDELSVAKESSAVANAANESPAVVKQVSATPVLASRTAAKENVSTTAPWTLRLEMHSDDAPGTTWAMELSPTSDMKVPVRVMSKAKPDSDRTPELLT